MNAKLIVLGIAGASLIGFGAREAFAGAKLQINDTSSIDFGYRLQVLNIYTDKDLDGDGKWDSYDDWNVRRARLRVGSVINEHVSIFLQTDISTNTVQMIDAYIQLKRDNWLQLIVGQNMAPGSRQNLTSSGALMAIDRPGQAYKSLTWGLRAASTFNTVKFADTPGLSGPMGVRDVGGTLFGSGSLGDNLSMKYYVGTYDGVQAAGNDEERMAARVQFNLGDAEGGYYNSSTYLGKKRTIGVGVSFDSQKKVFAFPGATDAADYTFLSADLFAEQPVGGGSLTFEGAFTQVDLGGKAETDHIEGSGFYAQFGYLLPNGKLQPWFLYEDWGADNSSDMGSYSLMRAGFTWFLAGQNANIKLGYENFTSGADLTAGGEDAVSSIVLGFFTNF